MRDGLFRQTIYLVAVVSVGGSPIRAIAQTPPVTYSGTVLSTDGTAIKGARVFITNAGPAAASAPAPDQLTASLAEPVPTTDGGKFSFTRTLPAGLYWMTVSADGFDTHTRRIEITDKNRTQDVLLKPRPFFIQFGERSGIDLTLIQPGASVFFDVGSDDPDEIDLFRDGKLSPSVQLVGLDFVMFSDRRQLLRLGINSGLGLITIKEPAPTSANREATKDVRGTMVSASLFSDLAKAARVEVGLIWGLSAGETGTTNNRDDWAVFVGVSLRTQLGDQLAKVFR